MRYGLIDAMRGFALINMVLYHFLYDVFVIFHVQPDWYQQRGVYIWQQGICWSFILISGFVWNPDQKKNAKRGLVLNLWGALISAVTWIVTPSEAIWFGILTFLGCAVWLSIPLTGFIRRKNAVLGFIISILLFFIFRDLSRGYLGLEGVWQLAVPDWLYRIRILTFAGFPYPGFYSSDYFPLFPWFFLFLGGIFLREILMQYEKWKITARLTVPGLSGMGRKSIWIYLLHQPVCMLICTILFS